MVRSSTLHIKPSQEDGAASRKKLVSLISNLITWVTTITIHFSLKASPRSTIQMALKAEPTFTQTEIDTCPWQPSNSNSNAFIFPKGKPPFPLLTHNLPSIQWKPPNLSCLCFLLCTKNSIIWRKSPHDILKISELKANTEYIYFQLSIIHSTRNKSNCSKYKSREAG